MHPVVLEAGTAIDRYEIVRPIATSHAATVYEAVDVSLRRRVALKVLHVRARRGAARFFAEVRMATQIRHPHVVDVFDVGTAGGAPYLVMELVEGDTLEEVLAREGRIALERTVEILLPILSAVVELHENSVLHRDFKPANVLLGAGPGLWPKLADFGGPPEALAPELLRRGGRATEKSDQYALGALLFECTTGQRCAPGQTELLAPSVHAPSLPGAFDAVVLRALERDPALRFASVRELAASLLPFATPAVASRWGDEFVSLESTTRPTAWAEATGTAIDPDDARPPVVETHDGVAVATRGDTFIMVWKSAARLPRSRWTFDHLDRFAAGRSSGFRVLMIILPSADPPDAAARAENDRRTRKLAPGIRRFATVIIGDTVWQVLVRGIIRAMVVPHPQLAVGTSTIDFTVEAGVSAILRGAGPATPSFACLLGDIGTLFGALGEEPPAREGARRSRSGIDLRPSRRPRKSA